MEIYTDGAARNNPGPSASAFVVVKRGKVVHSASAYLGKKTNNEAEYTAIILALRYAIKNGENKVYITTDSMLVSQQISGTFKTKSQKLAKYLEKVKKLSAQLKEFKITYAPRETEFIAEADRLCNEILDIAS